MNDSSLQPLNSSPARPPLSSPPEKLKGKFNMLIAAVCWRFTDYALNIPTVILADTRMKLNPSHRMGFLNPRYRSGRLLNPIFSDCDWKISVTSRHQNETKPKSQDGIPKP